LENEYQIKNIKLGFLDITFFRDDFRRGEKQLDANKTQIDFLVEDQKVVFIDDVLFTGRSINAALTAIQSFGRPSEVELLVLIDRRFSRHLPIQPDYRGRQVDVINDEKVTVCWKEKDGEDAVFLI
jgi:pyrimidine operon attenuation protein/uracil phosphoribosyltransferase